VKVIAGMGSDRLPMTMATAVCDQNRFPQGTF